MWNKSRIDSFCKELAKVWKKYVPNWSFGQFVNNVLGTMQLEGKDIFDIDDKEMTKYFNEYFEKRHPPF